MKNAFFPLRSAFAEWCRSDDPAAVEVRKKQIMLILHELHLLTLTR